MKLQLVSHLIGASGDRVIVALQPTTKDRNGDYINWSELKDHQRLPFVLLQERYGNVRPLVFVGDAGTIRPFKWKNKKANDAITAQSSSAKVAFNGLISGAFDGTVDDWICDRCACRTICPWWIGAIH